MTAPASTNAEGMPVGTGSAGAATVARPGVFFDMTGHRYGRLTVIASAGRRWKDKRPHWRCLCDCGKESVVAAKFLRGGNTKSCGCLQAEVRHARVTHGMSGTPTWQSWASMKTRCSNPKQEAYARYGALGVTVCQRWQDSFENFLADMGERPEGKTLDRRNPFGNYEPNNCRWANSTEQANNRRADIALRMLAALPGPIYEQLMAAAIAAINPPTEN